MALSKTERLVIMYLYLIPSASSSQNHTEIAWRAHVILFTNELVLRGMYLVFLSNELIIRANIIVLLKSWAPNYRQNIKTNHFWLPVFVPWTPVSLNADQIAKVDLRLSTNPLCRSPIPQPIRFPGALFECWPTRCCYAADTVLSRVGTLWLKHPGRKLAHRVSY